MLHDYSGKQRFVPGRALQTVALLAAAHFATNTPEMPFIDAEQFDSTLILNKAQGFTDAQDFEAQYDKWMQDQWPSERRSKAMGNENLQTLSQRAQKARQDWHRLTAVTSSKLKLRQHTEDMVHAFTAACAYNHTMQDWKEFNDLTHMIS